MNAAVVELGLVFVVGLLLPTFPWLPVRLAILVPLTATTVSPGLVALTAAVATALGTWPLYAVSRKASNHARVQAWMNRPRIRRIMRILEKRMFLMILLFALLPLPDQVMSISGGLRRYPACRMILGFFLGRLPYFFFLAWLGSAHRDEIAAASQWFLRVITW